MAAVVDKFTHAIVQLAEDETANTLFSHTHTSCSHKHSSSVEFSAGLALVAFPAFRQSLMLLPYEPDSRQFSKRIHSLMDASHKFGAQETEASEHVRRRPQSSKFSQI
jgi:hypothetical protein